MPGVMKRGTRLQKVCQNQVTLVHPRCPPVLIPTTAIPGLIPTTAAVHDSDSAAMRDIDSAATRDSASAATRDSGSAATRDSACNGVAM